MQFTKIRLVGRYNIDLPFFGLRPDNPYIIKAADGLGPPEINNYLNKRVYQGRDVTDRQIVIRVGLNPDYSTGQTAASMRNTLYGLLTPGPSDSITVKFMNGPGVVALTTGYVSKIEIVPFAKDPEVQITIDCEGAYLEAETPTTLVPTTNDPFDVDNTGSVTVGFYLEATLTLDQSYFNLKTDPGGSAAKMSIQYAFLNGDILKIDTRADQKSIKRVRGGVEKSILGSLTADSVWLQLHPEVNRFWVDGTFDWGQVVYTPKYWGI